MVTKKLYRNTNEEISLLGFGCMRLPVLNGEDGKIDYDKALEMIDLAYKNGVNYFDTAWGYHSGESENFVGVALSRYARETFNIASKMPPWAVNSIEDVELTFNKQLEKCQVEYFDFYLEHCLNDENYDKLESFGTYEFLTRMKKEGKIRNLGFSFHGTVECLERITADHEWDFVQLQYNYLDTKISNAQKEYEVLKKHNLPMIVMEPVRGGVLADLCDEANAVLKEERPDESIASWAIRYAASNEDVITVLSGMSDESQVKDNIKTVTDFEKLTENDEKALNIAVNIFKDYFSIPCTKCRYCTKDCPQGIDIPEMLNTWGRYRLEKRTEDYKKRYLKVDKEARAVKCITCHLCESYCPQSIKIPEILSAMKELNKELGIEE